MKMLRIALMSWAMLAASPSFAQLDPGFRIWIEQPGLVETIDGDFIRYAAYRINSDGSTTYRLGDGSEITVEKAEIESEIIR